MVADSLPRRIIKKLIYPLIAEDHYAYFVALAKAWDIRIGAYPEAELDLIPLAVHADDTVLDIGANLGHYAYPLSRTVGPKGRVYAFEPVPFTYRTLGIVAQILRLRNVEIVPKGCSDRTESITFEIPLQENGALSAGLAYFAGRTQEHPGKDIQVRWKRTREVVADVIRLDEFLPPLSDLQFIKADAEGAEVFAFRGGERTISKHLPTVLCEINPWYLKGFGFTVSDLTSLFLDKGYQMYRYDNKKLIHTSPSEASERNYVFVHPSRSHRLRSVIEGQ